MKVNKEFIKILSKMKIGKVGEIIKEMNFLQIEKDAIQNLPEHYKTLEQIFYTVHFLNKEKFITIEYYASSPPPSFNPTKFKKDKFLIERLEHIDDLISNYWNFKIKITLKFYDFIDNKYKTDQQRDRIRNLCIPIVVAILASLLTFLFGLLSR